MKRICVVGNSHVGAIKKALEESTTDGQQEKTEIVIFGSHRNTLSSAYVKDGVIQSDDDDVQEKFLWTSGYATKIDISTFDEIVFVVGSSHFSILPFTVGGVIPQVSEGVFEAVWRAAEESWPFQLAKSAAKECENTLITYLGVPLRSVESPEAKMVLKHFNGSDMNTVNRARRIQHLMHEKADDWAKGNFRLKAPPKTALDEYGLFTQHKYCKGSVRLTKDLNTLHSGEDYNHMNAEYGKLVLEEFSG